MKIRYDKKADAIYILLSNAPYDYGEDLDEERRIDYDADGNPRGVELLCVSTGVDTDGLPFQGEIGKTKSTYHNTDPSEPKRHISPPAGRKLNGVKLWLNHRKTDD